MALLYIEKVKTNAAAFEEKVTQISARLGVDPNWLMLVMSIESGLDSTAVNKTTGATGLIQFMPSTAKQYKVTLAALKAMSNIQQLDYVEKYLSAYKGKIKSFLDLYLAVFFPLEIGKPLDTVVQTAHLSAGLIAKQNSGYDLRHDGKITLDEIATVLLKHVPPAFSGLFQLLKKKAVVKAGGGAALVGAAFLTYLFFKKRKKNKR